MGKLTVRGVVVGVLAGLALGTGGILGDPDPAFWLGLLPVLLFVLRSLKENGFF